MGVARDNMQAALIAAGPKGERPPPQLYTAPDPTEDPEADRAMQHLATLAIQAQNTHASGNTMLNATQVVLNQTRDFFVHGVLPMAGLDELDMFLLKKIGMLAHCGFENDMRISFNNITDQLMCAMRVHLMNESEIHVFCPKEARVWEDNCLNVEFLNYTAISIPNELNVVHALRNSITGLLASYPTTIEEDRRLLTQVEEGITEMGPIITSAVRLRYREKEILFSAIDVLQRHEESIHAGNVTFQLAMKALERLEMDRRDAEHKKFVEEVKRLAAIKPELAFVEVNMGDSVPKANLTLVEGADIKQTVQAFCQKHGVRMDNAERLEKALRARVKHPEPLSLMIGAVTNTGERHILAIPEGANATVVTGVFCAKYDNAQDATDTPWCQGLIKRVESRLFGPFIRKILLVVPIDAPDSRKLQLVIREGEQHDLVQLVTDFFELYHIPADNVYPMAQEVNKRLPGAVLTIPVGLSAQRQVVARFALNDNVTNVVEAFTNYFELDENVKIAILKRARHGMAPGTYML
jgi:hypothetical protein